MPINTIQDWAVLPDVDGWEKHCSIRKRRQLVSYTSSYGRGVELVVCFHFYSDAMDNFGVDVESRLEIDGDVVCKHEMRCRKDDVFTAIFADALKKLGYKFEELAYKIGELQNLGLWKGAIR